MQVGIISLKMKIGLFLSSLAVLLVSSIVPVNAQFDPLEQACQQNPDAAACIENQQAQSGVDPLSGNDGIIISVANIIATATAVISVIIIIIAGIMMTMAQGDAGKVKTARDAIIYAAVGVVVVALARGIVVFIVNRLN